MLFLTHTQHKEHGPSQSSIKAVSSLVALQLVSRLFTFALNQALFRLATPHAYGTAAIQFELLLSTILFLSREGVRNGSLRAKTRTVAVTNISIIPILIGVPLAILAASSYVALAKHEVRRQAYFGGSVATYALAAVLELMSEPMHNMAMSELRTSIRLKAEGLGITFKTLLVFGLLVFDSQPGHESFALLAFAAGQLTYSLVVLTVYIGEYGIKLLQLKQGDSSQELAFGLFDPHILKLASTMTSQSLMKHVLTEGDKLVLSAFSPLQDQGGYAIAVNYGSLVARIVFQPVEETLRIYYSKLVPVSTTDQKEIETASDQLRTTFSSVLAVQVSLSLIILTFGAAYLPILLPIALPPQYMATSAPQVISAWLWYIPILALNGGLEAFLSSVASPQQLNSQSRWMTLFSISYISGAILLYKLGLGDVALVYANILNLLGRIFYVLIFASSYLRLPSITALLRAALPTWPLVFATAIASFVVRGDDHMRGIKLIVLSDGRRAILQIPVLLHIALGGVSCLFCLAAWWRIQGVKMWIQYGTRPKTN